MEIVYAPKGYPGFESPPLRHLTLLKPRWISGASCDGENPVRSIEIKHVLKSALTTAINDREVFMKGIDASYYYEGYSVYRVQALVDADR